MSSDNCEITYDSKVENEETLLHIDDNQLSNGFDEHLPPKADEEVVPDNLVIDNDLKMNISINEENNIEKTESPANESVDEEKDDLNEIEKNDQSETDDNNFINSEIEKDQTNVEESENVEVENDETNIDESINEVSEVLENVEPLNEQMDINEQVNNDEINHTKEIIDDSKVDTVETTLIIKDEANSDYNLNKDQLVEITEPDNNMSGDTNEGNCENEEISEKDQIIDNEQSNDISTDLNEEVKTNNEEGQSESQNEVNMSVHSNEEEQVEVGEVDSEILNTSNDGPVEEYSNPEISNCGDFAESNVIRDNNEKNEDNDTILKDENIEINKETVKDIKSLSSNYDNQTTENNSNTYCYECKKIVYPLEKLSTKNGVYHKLCFRCTKCRKTLTPANISFNKDKPYCTPHYMELFKKRGKYDDDDNEDNNVSTTNDDVTNTIDDLPAPDTTKSLVANIENRTTDSTTSGSIDEPEFLPPRDTTKKLTEKFSALATNGHNGESERPNPINIHAEFDSTSVNQHENEPVESNTDVVRSDQPLPDDRPKQGTAKALADRFNQASSISAN